MSAADVGRSHTPASPRSLPSLRLHLGCGSVVADGWVNVDYALGARLARLPGFRSLNRAFGLFRLDWHPDIFVHDLRKPLPWAGGSVGAVYTSHTLEHFSREGGAALMDEIRRVLVPGGLLRVVVPDLACIVARYVRGELPADRLVDALDVHCENGERGLRSRLASLIGFPHRCMYDAPALLELFHAHGFEARARRHHDSDIDDIAALELESRTNDAVIVEGRRR